MAKRMVYTVHNQAGVPGDTEYDVHVTNKLRRSFAREGINLDAEQVGYCPQLGITIVRYYEWDGEPEPVAPNEPMTPPWIRQDGPATYSVSRKGGVQELHNVR